MKKCVFFLIMLLGISLHGYSQKISPKLKEAKWVKIMTNDSSYNFFEADAEFQKYYASYLKEKKKEEKRKTVNPSHAEEEHMKSPDELLIWKYREWVVTITPFVKSDGSIIPLSKRLAIINEERNKQSSKQIPK